MDAVVLSNVGKSFRHYPSQWDRLLEWIDPFNRKRHSVHWILKNIDLKIKRGESVGIVGMNGAGKSSLLKIIARTVPPNCGTVNVFGTCSALLELGMGFHPEFSGRQNIYMAGQLLGLSAGEIDALMPSLESFAEIGSYIDEPLRVYSSGMQMRLAFSIATARRPDLLIVDEALSVGDAYFQQKSFAKIRNFKEQGTTLLIVSHDKQAIKNICDRVLLMKDGAIVSDGPPDEVMDYYNALLAEHLSQVIEQTRTSGGKLKTRSGTGEAIVQSIDLLDEQGQKIDVVRTGQRVFLNVLVQVNVGLKRLVFGFGIRDKFGQVVYGTNTHHTDQPIYNLKSGEILNYIVSFEANLGPGTYSIQTALHSEDTHIRSNYDWVDTAMMFSVVNFDKPLFEGSAYLLTEIKIAHIS